MPLSERRNFMNNLGNFTMKTDDELKSDAFLIYNEWGPNLRIPREDRLKAYFPKISSEVLRNWIIEFDSIHSFVWEIAKKGAGKSVKLDKFREDILRLHGFMNDEAIKKVWWLSNYYAWHEGY